MSIFQKWLLGSLTAIGVAALSQTAALADPILVTLDPTQPNTGCAPANCGQIDSMASSISQTTTLSFDFYSNLNIAAPTGSTTFSESALLVFTSLNNSASSSPGGANLPGARYLVYGVLNMTGTGTWLVPGNFSVTGLSTFAFNLFAQPNTGTQPTFASGGPPTLTPGSKDFQIATVTPSPGGSFAGFALTSGGTGTTFLSADLLINPLTGFQGPTGFFNDPVPFNLVLSTSSSSNTGNTKVTGGTNFVVGSCSQYVASTGCSFGNGTAEFLSIPEPGSMAILGSGLLGLGFFARRRARRAAKERIA